MSKSSRWILSSSRLRSIRLLDARALIYENTSQLVNSDEVGSPEYAILSHTWDVEEITFSDIPLGPCHEITTVTKAQRSTKGYRRYYCHNAGSCSETPIGVDQIQSYRKKGWSKIWNACLQACRDDFGYIWIDTCCIDQSSSAELSEVVNSMFSGTQSLQSAMSICLTVSYVQHEPVTTRNLCG